MKLIDDFFKIIETSVIETGFYTSIKLNPSHIVYTGHFPGYPVTPGVIQLQIVHELLEKHFGRKLKLITMPQSKFLKILNPEKTPQLVVYIEFEKKEAVLNIKAWGKNGADIYFKLNSCYQF
ncbi:MAG: 3-hydroxyacyl-[acyl-carrier-protein] dehydratase [Saprospiraceae bacterium]|jgi:3-hydroxyacyl-[acyl-carrier-protein] dehydratase